MGNGNTGKPLTLILSPKGRGDRNRPGGAANDKAATSLRQGYGCAGESPESKDGKQARRARSTAGGLYMFLRNKANFLRVKLHIEEIGRQRLRDFDDSEFEWLCFVKTKPIRGWQTT
jgi:hypothetical protein